MAKKKPKTPPPPRKVQAPQRRHAHRDDLGARQRNILYAVSAAGIVALIAVVAFVAIGGGSSGPNDKKVAGLMTAAGCSFKTVDGLSVSCCGTETGEASASARRSAVRWDASSAPVDSTAWTGI